MWMKENRRHYDRSRLSYPSDFAYEERALAEPLIAPEKGGSNKHKADAREVVSGLTNVPRADWSDGKVAIHPCSDSAVDSHDQSAETIYGH